VRHRTSDEINAAERLYGPGLRDPYANNQLLHEQDPATNNAPLIQIKETLTAGFALVAQPIMIWLAVLSKALRPETY